MSIRTNGKILKATKVLIYNALENEKEQKVHEQ
jgi:hypothetical protein